MGCVRTGQKHGDDRRDDPDERHNEKPESERAEGPDDAGGEQVALADRSQHPAQLIECDAQEEDRDVGHDYRRSGFGHCRMGLNFDGSTQAEAEPPGYIGKDDAAPKDPDRPPKPPGGLTNIRSIHPA